MGNNLLVVQMYNKKPVSQKSQNRALFFFLVLWPLWLKKIVYIKPANAGKKPIPYCLIISSTETSFPVSNFTAYTPGFQPDISIVFSAFALLFVSVSCRITLPSILMMLNRQYPLTLWKVSFTMPLVAGFG